MDNRKILIVDSSKESRKELVEILGGLYEIIEAEDGVCAINVLERQGHELSLVLLDMIMPEAGATIYGRMR